MAISGTSVLTAPVNVMFQQQLLRVAMARCPHFIGAVPGRLVSNQGTFTITWRRHDALTPTTTALTEDSGTLGLPVRTSTTLAVTDVSATIQKYGVVTYLTEEASLINFNGQTAGVVKTLAIQAGRSLNRLQRNVLEDSTTLIRASGATDDTGIGDAIGSGLIRNARNVLNRNSSIMFTGMSTGDPDTGTSPVMAAYWGVCHSDVEEDIAQLTGFKSVETYAGQIATANGEFGATGGVRWVSSPEASVDADSGAAAGDNLRSTGGSNADLYTAVVMGLDYHGSVSLDVNLINEVYTAGDDIPGIMMINHPAGSSGVADALNEINAMSWKAWHAGTELNDDFARGIRVAASVLE